jgi:hypothetical protein
MTTVDGMTETPCHVKIYAKTVQMMMSLSRFSSLGSKVHELLYANPEMDENLRKDLCDGEQRGMSRIEVSFFGYLAGAAALWQTDLELFVDYIID